MDQLKSFYEVQFPIFTTGNLPLDTFLGIKVENNVIIALGANVISGVTIGENTIVAAGSTVVCDIKPNTIVFGTPAKERNGK